MNEAGRDLVEWCEEYGLAYVNSFMRHKRRGTWFNRMYGRWYELDGFVVRREERSRLVRQMRTVEENALSDHKPKSMRVRVEVGRWRAVGGERRRARIQWELLRDEEKRMEYREATRVRMAALNDVENEGDERMRWGAMSGVMVESAREVCGEARGTVSNEWMIGHEAEVEEMRVSIDGLVRERNEKLERLRARRRLRLRPGNVEVVRMERELDMIRVRLREVRMRKKRMLREWEREWWREKIQQCEEACRGGRVGEMYKLLRGIGRRRWKAPASGKITAEEFREHFEKVSSERYEVEPSVIRRAVEGANDLR